MSIGKKYITIPDTLRGASVNIETMPMPESLFIHLEDFYFSESEFIDEDFWHDNLGINIFPLHGIEEFTPEDLKNTLTDSLQDFTWKSKKGIYRQRMTFNWSIDYHQILTELSSSKLYAIYAASNILRGVLDNGNIRGFNLSAFEFEPFAFSTNKLSGNSELYIEHYDSDELNTNGYQAEIDWLPKKMDRLPVTIDITLSESKITLTVKYFGNLVTGIEASEISIYDKINGYVGFSTFVPGDGYYQLSNFDKIISYGTIFVKSRLYIGCKSFIYNYTIKDGVGLILMSGDDFLLMDDNSFLLMEEKLTLTITYGGFFTHGNGYRTMYFRITDSNGNIIEDLDRTDFTATSGTINSGNFVYINNGVYSWYSFYSDTGTLTLSNDDYIATLNWDLTGLFYEANMDAMYLLLGKYYLPPNTGFNFTQNETFTNPDNDKWNIIISASTTRMYLSDLVIGQSYDIVFDIDSISAIGRIVVKYNTSQSQSITTSGTTTITFTATAIDVIIEFDYEGGSLETLINSIKIEIN